MTVTVKLLRLDRAEVMIANPWWRLRGDHGPRLAARTRYGWHWEDNQDPIVDRRVLDELGAALKRVRGY